MESIKIDGVLIKSLVNKLTAEDETNEYYSSNGTKRAKRDAVKSENRYEQFYNNLMESENGNVNDTLLADLEERERRAFNDQHYGQR